MDNFHANWKVCVVLIIKLADEKKKKIKKWKCNRQNFFGF